MFDFIMKGGVLIYPIIFCSVIALAIIVERLYHFWRAGINIDDFYRKVRDSFEKGGVSEAKRIARKGRGPVAKVTALVLESEYHGMKGPEETIVKKNLEETIHRVGSQEIRKLERNLRGLSIISNITPLLGLLGTVTGMIRAFMKIQELGGRVDAAILAGGIWEAMITTGAGLTVAIPAMVAYHLFEGRVDDISAAMRDIVSEIGGLLGVQEFEDFVEESKMVAIKDSEGYGL